MGAKYCSRIRFLLVYAIIITLTKSGLSTVTQGSCKTGCTKSESLLRYIPGNVYEYNFDSILSVGIHGSTGITADNDDDTSLKLSGNAKIFAQDNCGYTLQLGAIKVTAVSDSIEKKITQNIQKPIYFTITNGNVEPQICADITDNTFSLNIKRAIISLLQSNPETQNEIEVDVFGACPTSTSISNVGSTKIVTKLRNLNNCAHREKINSGIISGVINENAGIKSTTLLKADYAKELKLKDGLIDSVQLTEIYKTGGSEKLGSNVVAKVFTTLKLKNTAGSPVAAPGTSSNSVNIIFEKPETTTTKNIAVLKAALSDVIALIDDYVQKGSSKNFMELIRLMRNADVETLQELSTVAYPNKVLARKVYLDALFRTGTAESAKVILKQLNKMDEKEKNFAILSLNLVQNVDKDILQNVASLLNANAAKEIYLVAGNLISKFCQTNICNQGELDNISKKFLDNLKQCKANTKKDEERIIYILKGIGNMKNLAGNLIPVLSECAATGRSNRIRVAALQSFTANSCQPALQKKALELLRQYDEDSELRIEAYLAAINCVNPDIANSIADIVNNEPVYQVGSFIESNLRTIRDSTDPTLELQRYHLGNIRVTKRFPNDYRRYSFNNEVSYKLDALGFSASSNYKVIYSQHGFLPRSGRLNVSAEFFGTNFNIFEANVRQENIENLLEYYIGPKGLLNKDFDEIMKVIETGDHTGRTRRSIADDSNKFAKKYKTYGTKTVQDINLDLSLKLFGSEISFLSLGDNIPSSLEDILKQFSKIFEKVKQKLSSYEEEFLAHALFLNTHFVYPSGVGIPLELSAQGFASNKLQFGVNVDVDEILGQNWQHTKYHFKLVPSVDINLKIQLGFNAHVISKGIRVDSTLQSATGGDIHFAFINEGNGFSLDLELPREKIELININSDIAFYTAEQDKALSVRPLGNKKIKDNTELCYNQLDTVGVSLCISTSQPEAPNKGSTKHPLQSQYSLSVWAITERKFNFKGQYIHEPNTGVQKWKLEFSTPGSKESHDNSLTFELGTKPRTYGRISFDNSKTHYGLEAGINNDNNELVLYAQYEQNTETKKNKIGFLKNGNVYNPIVEVQTENGVSNEINGYRIDGRVVVQKSSDTQARYNFENLQVTKSNEKIVLNGWADIEQFNSFNSEVHIAPGKDSYFVKSNIKLKPNEYAIGLFINNDAEPQNIYGGSVALSLNLQEPNQDIFIQLVGKAASWALESTNEIQIHKNENSNGISNGKLRSEAVIKNKNEIITSLKINGFTESQNKYEVNVELGCSKRQGSVAFKLHRNNRSQGDYNLDINAKLNNHFINLISKLDINGNRFVTDNALSTSWGTLLTVKGELGQRFTPQDIVIDLLGSIQLNNKVKPTLWLIKIIGAPDKTNAEIKITREDSDLIKLNSEWQHPQEKIGNGKLNLIIKNVANVKSDFKIAKNGKGEVTTTVDTLNTDEKHKIDVFVKFHVLAPKYDVDVLVNLDTAKQIHFKTENILDKQKATTKNIVEIGDKKLTLDANSLIKGDYKLNGEVQGNFILTLPNGHIFDGNAKRKATTSPKTANTIINSEVQLNEQTVDGKRRSFNAVTKIDKLNLRAKEIIADSQISFKNDDNKKLIVNSYIKHLSKGEKKTLDFGVKGSGDLYNIPVDISIVLPEYSSQNAEYQVVVQIGDYLNSNIQGKYSLGESERPAVYEVHAVIDAPKTTFKTYNLQYTSKFLKPNLELSKTEANIYMVDIQAEQKIGENHYDSLNAYWKGSPQNGDYKLALKLNKLLAPITVDGNYQLTYQNDEGGDSTKKIRGKQAYILNYGYGNEYLKIKTDLNYEGIDYVSLHYVLESSITSINSIDIEVLGRKLEDNSYELKTQAKHSNKNYELDAKIFQSSFKKGLDLRANLANDKPLIIIGIIDLLGERKAKLTAEIKNLIDIDFDATGEASYKNANDFYIFVKWNSVKLNLNKYDLNIQSKGAAINLKLRNAKESIFTGSTTYALKKEKNKSVIEGQGQVQYRGKSENINFRLIRQTYDITTDKEIGFSYSFNSHFGLKNVVSTLKVTNNDFNIKLSVCEEKKQCSNLQLQSIISADAQNLDTTQHSFLILIDVRELGYPYEFEFQSKTIRQGIKFQYSLDTSIISNNNLKYQLYVNLLPSESKVQLKLPKREILLISFLKYPQHGRVFGVYENTLEFYFDKVNKPNDVTRLTSNAELNGVEQIALNAKGGIRFEHPNIRPLSVSGKVDINRQQKLLNIELTFDVFKLPQQKIIAISQLRNNVNNNNGFNISIYNELSSNDLNLKYEISGHAALNLENAEFSSSGNIQSGTNDVKGNIFIYGNKNTGDILVNVLNNEVYKLHYELNQQNLLAKFNSKWDLFGQNLIQFESELQPKLAKFALRQSNLLNANGEIKLDKEIKFNIEGVDIGQLYNGRIALDSGNFLQTQFMSNENNIEHYLQNAEIKLHKQSQDAVNRIKQNFENLRQQIDAELQRSRTNLPDLTKLKANYQTNLNEIYQEIENDPSLTQISEIYRNFYTSLVQISSDTVKTISQLFESIQQLVVKIYEKVGIIVKDTILPAWEKFAVESTKIISEIVIKVGKLFTGILTSVLKVLEKYGPTLKNYGKGIKDILKPINEAVQEFIKHSSRVAEEITKELNEYIKNLPSLETIRNKFNQKMQEWKVPDTLLEIFENVIKQAHVLPITPDMSELLNKIYNFIESVLRQKPIDTEKELQEILQLILRLPISVWNELASKSPGYFTDIPNKGIGLLFQSLYVPTEYITKIPAILTLRFSVINFILNENLENFFSKEHYKSWIYSKDFDLTGHIADGKHIFTFDGQHYPFPGTGKYILAQDSIDNNFTVVAQLNNGKLKSIILINHDDGYIEISDSGSIKHNGNPSEYPLHESDLHAWRKYYTIWLKSTYGIEIMCTTDLKVCHINVNGFYTSKVRGLLGNGNAEPYDDFIQVDGTIASDYATFGNGYGLGKCSPVSLEDNSNVNHAEICNEFFSIQSPLAIGFFLIDSTPYRTACDQAVKAVAEKDKEAAACAIASAYGSALRFKKIFVSLPISCLKCNGPVGQREIGQEFTVKIPNNKADILFLVDVGVNDVVLQNLVAPSVNEIRDSLKTRGITDVQISVIAYNESQRYPALLSSDNGKLNYVGNLAEVQLNGPKHFCNNCVSQIINDKRILDILELIEHFIKNALPQPDQLAWRMALDFPFRASAAKSIIVVRSNPLNFDNFLSLANAYIESTINKFEIGSVHLIAPVENLNLEGVATEKLIGFNSRLVATLDGKDAKKRQKLQFKNDLGIDYVLNNGGWVFASQNFNKLNRQDQKKALNQVTNSIADTLYKTETASDCKCLPIHGLHAQHKCTIKSSTFVQNKKPKAA